MQRNKLVVFAALVLVLVVLAACGNGAAPGTDGNGGGGTTAAVTPEGATEIEDILASVEGVGLDPYIEGELTVMMWGRGGHEFLRDVGRFDMDPADINSRYGAAVTAAARVFNEMFPNVIINVVNTPGPTVDGAVWIQQRENFFIEHGIHADIFMVDDLGGEVDRGMVADLTIFQDDVVFQSYNPTIMRMMNFHGRQFGVPVFIIPWGIFVNRALAETHNIDVPSPHWDWNEYVRFVSNSQQDVFYGSTGINWPLMDTGTRDFHYLLLNRGPDDPFVRFDTEPMRTMLTLAPAMVPHAIWTQNYLGNVSQEFLDDHGGWGWRMFSEGSLLSFYHEPWQLSIAASPEYPWAVQSPDWDIFPRPSTNYVGNHLGTVLDPMAIRNFAMDDGDPALSEEEYLRLRLAWEFVRFYTADPRSWQARSDFMYGPYNLRALDEGFPFVTGQMFYDLMDIWFQAPEREAFRDANRFPGFHQVMMLWEQGQFWGLWHNAFPWYYEFEGSRQSIPWEWGSKWSTDVTGAFESDPNWLDMAFARLPEWEAITNQRWVDRFQLLYESIAHFYPEQTRPGS